MTNEITPFRIEITDADLNDPETRLNLAVALRVQGLLDL